MKFHLVHGGFNARFLQDSFRFQDVEVRQSFGHFSYGASGLTQFASYQSSVSYPGQPIFPLLAMFEGTLVKADSQLLANKRRC